MPAWQSPIDVAEGSHSANDPADLAMDAKGDTLLVWVQNSGTSSVIEAAWRPAGGAFNAPVRLSPPSVKAFSPTVAMDEQGDATVAWQSYYNPAHVVEVAWRPAGGVFSTLAKPLGGEESEDPVVAMDSRGDATVAWVLFNGVFGIVEAASRPAGGTFGKPVELSAYEMNAKELAIAMDPQDDTAIAWILNKSLPKSEPPYLVQIATRYAGAGFGAPTEFHLDHDYFPAVAMDSRGDATVVWGREDQGSETETIEASTRTAVSGGFEAPVVIAKHSSTLETSEVAHEVAMNAAGDTTVAWGSRRSVVGVATRPAGGSFNQAVELSSPNLYGGLPAVAMDDRGDSVVVWAGTGEAGSFPLGSTAQAGGMFGAPVFLSNAGDLTKPEIGLVQPVSVAMDAQGDAVSAWMSSNGTKDILQVAGYQATGPELEALQAPTEGQSGAALAFSVSPLSVWSTIASTTWSWGDGSPDTSGTSVTHMFDAPGTYQVSVSATDALGNVTDATSAITIQASPPTIQIPPIILPVPPPQRKTKIPQAIVSAFTPLFATRASNGGSTLGLLVGIAAVRGARDGDTILVRCIAGCQRPLREIVHVRRHHNARGAITISPPLLLHRATRIEIELLARGHVARFVQYRFSRTPRGVIAQIARKGCLSSTGRPRVCP
jgi:PKD domain